nr:MAG TPA: hypothetical protein [Caudoviricetes sp.]DAL97320.1 MAG TPA: hypothetical protein [Caudoviricetes sp.]
MEVLIIIAAPDAFVGAALIDSPVLLYPRYRIIVNELSRRVSAYVNIFAS